MKKILFLALICLGLQSYAVRAEDSLQIVRYVNAMARYAVSEMHRSGVPASVSLAQGILETAAGTSPLYSRSYNNFGIKCKANWTGPYTLHDDDAQGECFRVYDNDSLSYVDHSAFLRTAPRYNFLFQLDKTDYRGWAIGLKKAGYATNPKYSMKLIEYIEKYNLDAYDHLTVAQLSSSPRLAMHLAKQQLLIFLVAVLPQVHQLHLPQHRLLLPKILIRQLMVSILITYQRFIGM
jgi:flagellum-specific peptidoglycan hydrolase FlgJ